MRWFFPPPPPNIIPPWSWFWRTLISYFVVGIIGMILAFVVMTLMVAAPNDFFAPWIFRRG